jgi:DNA-binding NarL/FixJ family response regulator
MSITVVIGSDQRLLVQGLRGLLADHPELAVLGEASDGHAAIRAALELRPDLVLLSSRIQRLNALDVTQRITHGEGGSRVILLDAEPDRHFIVTGLGYGVSGFLLRESSFEELLQAIETVRRGQPYLSPRITGVVVDEVLRGQGPESRSAFSVLTNREREVLQLIAEGSTTKEIAARLGVSGKTVEWHRTQIMRKLELRSVAGLTRYAIREGLIPLMD